MSAPIVPVLPETIALAAEIISGGGLVAVPTETVYGLAADATNPEAIARLYSAKGRPRFNPLIAHIATIDMAEQESVLEGDARRLAGKFWPGALTLVLPVARTATVCDIARAGLDTVALRWPKHSGTAALIRTLGRPLAAPSANISGHVSPTRPEHVLADLGDVIDLILDGGTCSVGMESTILGFDGAHVVRLRPGGATTDEIEAHLGRTITAQEEYGAVTAPGQLKSHYAPRARLRLNAAEPETGEAFLGFGDCAPPGLNLSRSGNLAEAAANLFAMLRELDAEHDRIAVAPIPEVGLGEAINDRLRRAAHRD